MQYRPGEEGPDSCRLGRFLRADFFYSPIPVKTFCFLQLQGLTEVCKVFKTLIYFQSSWRCLSLKVAAIEAWFYLK